MNSIGFDHAQLLSDGHHHTSLAGFKAKLSHPSLSSSVASSSSISSSSSATLETELFPLPSGSSSSSHRRRSITPDKLDILPEEMEDDELAKKEATITTLPEETEIKICGEYLEDVDPELKGLTWDESQSAATYVGQQMWHIPPALTLNYGARIRKLDLSYNCLRTLAGIQYFNCLEELILDNNLLDDSIRFFYNPCMRTLSINKNKITDLERFLNETSLKLPGLTYLSMLGNPACPDQLSSSEHDENDYRRYRSYVLHRMPLLKFLDSTSVRAAERAEAQKRGHYYRLIRLNSDSQLFEKSRYRSPSDSEVELPPPPSRANGLTPLPYQDSDEVQPKGGFGRLRHRYTGKHSEGNRFIKNHEL